MNLKYLNIFILFCSLVIFSSCSFNKENKVESNSGVVVQDVVKSDTNIIKANTPISNNTIIYEDTKSTEDKEQKERELFQIMNNPGCENKKIEKSKNSCYTDFAIASKDIKLCEKINNSKDILHCRDLYVLSTAKSIEDCKQASSPDIQKSCESIIKK